MVGIRTKAIKLIKENKVKLLSESHLNVMIEVDKETVILKKKAGRTLISCSCQNHSRFCIENPVCSHKLAALFEWVSDNL